MTSSHLVGTNINPNVFNKSYIDNSRISSSTKQEASYDVINMQFKVILLGDVGVGKTTLFKRFVFSEKNTTYSPSIAVNMDVKSMYLDANTRVKMKIFDTAGQETFRSTTKNYIIGSKGIILLFSVINASSFTLLKEWIKIIDDVIGITETTIFIVGNKIDRDNERMISFEVAEKFAKERNFIYVEISAQEGMNVDYLFEKLALEMVKNSCDDNDLSNNTEGKGMGKAVGHSLLSGKGFNKNQNKNQKYKEAKCC